MPGTIVSVGAVFACDWYTRVPGTVASVGAVFACDWYTRVPGTDVYTGRQGGGDFARLPVVGALRTARLQGILDAGKPGTIVYAG